jgi:hypothetical protein
MEPASQGAQLAAFLVFSFAWVATLSALAAVNAGRLREDLPWPLRLALWSHHRNGRPSSVGAIWAVILVILAQIVPVATLFAPTWSVGVLMRLAALAFFGAEITWFVYLRRHLV